MKETENLVLLKNRHEVSKFYQSNDEVSLTPLDYEKLSPIRYVIEKSNKKYVIFTEPYNENWQLESQKPKQMEAVNLYESSSDCNLKYKRFRIYLFSYVISAIALASLIVILMRREDVSH